MQGASLVHTILYSNTVHTLRLYLLSSPGGPGRGKPPLDFNHDCIQNIQIQIDEAADISQGERERNSRLNSEKRLDHAHLTPGGGCPSKVMGHPTPKDVYKLLGVRGPTPKDVYKLLGV